MSLVLQDPTNAASSYLLERMLDACKGAVRGGGAFAWATSAGVQLLLEDPTFKGFLGRGPFDLVLGIDAITDKSALAKLCSLTASTPSLRVSIFLHNRPNALYHPKVCWFADAKGGTVIAGSGNLTVGGLRGNWEAFAIQGLAPSELAVLESEWAMWKKQHQSVLRDPNHPTVLAEAAKNVGWRSRKRAADGESGIPDTLPEAPEAPAFAADAEVLVAEIPRAGTRWNQANFDVRTYEDYFGAKVGTQRRVLLQHVDEKGQLEAIESRPSVEVASKNYRFELAAAAGIAYPAVGRPTAVFIRQPTGVIAYRLLLPSHKGFKSVAALLDAEWEGRSDRMRRIVTTVDKLRTSWPSAPFWKTTPLATS